MKLTKEQANQVWAILAATCGASDDDMRQQFVYHSNKTDRLEFRFQGDLGFGGKVYVEEPPRVSCYSEDDSLERSVMIEQANERLCLLWGDWESER